MKVTISYEWWRSDDRCKPPASAHEQRLREAAEERIFSQLQEGYIGGQLIAELNGEDGREDDEIGYEGWWSVSTAA